MLARVTRTYGVLAAAGVLATAGLVGCQHLDVSHGRRFYELKQYDEADVRLSRIVAEDPTDWEAHYYLGLVRLEQNRPLDAELLLEQALRLRPDSPETAQILDALAEALFRQERTAALYAMLQEATQYYGTSHDYVRQAIYLGKSGDADGAVVAFRKAGQFAAPDDPSPYLAAADYYESIGNNPQAVIALRHALYIRPNDPAIGNRLRKHGVVPGPAAALAPQREE